MRIPTTVLGLLLLVACNSGPASINYGSDSCHYCKMTIVEKPFACEVVTAKGKITKYDAIECMVAHLHEEDLGEGHKVYVTDYAEPGTLMDGTSASFIKSKSIPSPMGGNLSAHLSDEAAQTALGTFDGEVLNWTAVQSSN